MVTISQRVPGVVTHHSDKRTRRYVGCPSVQILADGNYVASHSYFGPGSSNTDSFVYRSVDRGNTWERIAQVRGSVWSNLFIHDGDLYLMGTDHCDRFGGKFHGRVVIRRSSDDGRSWSTANGAKSGLLTDEEGWHTAPCPTVEHNGRLWRSIEFAPEYERATWSCGVLSAPVDTDLLDRASWRFSEQMKHLWSQSQWIEGNIVVAPDGELLNLLRWNDKGGSYSEPNLDRAVIVHVSSDGRRLTMDREQDIIEFPGGGTKFTIRGDEQSGRYWSLVNVQDLPEDPPPYRNHLCVSSSKDLRSWTVHEQLLYHPDPEFHAFQYVDWAFDGDDIIYVSRTAYDDDTGGAKRAHAANFLTFHRLESFRDLTGSVWHYG